MKLNIIIPCKNVATKINECYMSVLKAAQNFDYHIYFVNDESSDATQKVIFNIASTDTRVSSLNSRGGKMAAQQKVMRLLSKNVPILFVDGDVRVDMSSIEKLYEQLVIHEELLIVSGRTGISDCETQFAKYNLSRLFPLSKVVQDDKYNFKRAQSDPQPGISPYTEQRLKSFFHGSLFLVRSKSILPENILQNNIPDDIYWNYYVWSKYGPGTMRVILSAVAYVEPRRSAKELVEYRERIKSQLSLLFDQYPQFKKIHSSFIVKRDIDYINNLSANERALFFREVEEKEAIDLSSLKLSWGDFSYELAQGIRN